MRIAGVEDNHLLAAVEGDRPGLIHRGDRVVFRNRQVVITDNATIDANQIRWVDPDSLEWVR